MSAKTIKERAKELIDNLSTDEAKLILKLLERFNEERGTGEAVKMRTKKLLATFLLGVGLCLMPSLGYGEVGQELREIKISRMDFLLLDAKIEYIMRNPTNFLNVDFHDDPVGWYGLIEKFPVSINTKGRIFVDVRDSRGVFSNKSGAALLEMFKRKLEVLYSFIKLVATDMDTDVVAKFYSEEGIPLGYFYQGEYNLWETNRVKGTTKEEVTPPVPFLFENVTVWEISRVGSGAVLGTRLKGEVMNQSGVTYKSHAWFKVTLYDRTGEVLGWREFTTFDLRDGERKSFKVTFYDINLSDVWDWKIEFDRGS